MNGTGNPKQTGAWAELVDSVRADHHAMRSGREKYKTEGSSMRSSGLLGDAIQKIGFQMMLAYRIMRFVRRLGIPLAPQLLSRLIRHLYGAEIHWDATVEPGVSIVHGSGLVLSHGSIVGSGSILFQGVTLGESIDPFSRVVGAPKLENDVHVGPGAVLLGPIVVGAKSKIMANVVLDRSVPPGSVVRSSNVVIESRQTDTITSKSGSEKSTTCTSEIHQEDETK
jgi:serine acetyltransferase